ncbi:MAG: hypothetical protein LBP92_04335 [Deltaproteobacteria bacterium]|jgi:hypothetical protein|nr:hypothetical protein [Deltaproteobacteria bacterium]
MSDYYLNVARSVLSFSPIFLTFTVVTGFWGRLVLSALKTPEKMPYGHPLAQATGLAVVVFLGWMVNHWLENYGLFLNIVFYAGVLGFLAEVIFLRLRQVWKIRNDSAGLAILVRRNWPILGAFLQALVMVILYSAIWPSGQMEIWMSRSTDFFYWALFGDYLRGFVDVGAIPLSPVFFQQVRDSFGTHLVFALFTLATGKTALFSLPALAITLMAWGGAAVQSLASRIFGLGFWASLLVALGLIGGAFYNYVAVFGMIGQLLAMFGFLAAIECLFGWPDVRWPGSRELKRLFPPLFLIFLAYQGGYLAFAATVAMAAAFLGFFVSRDASIGKRLAQGGIWGLWPIVAVTLVGSLLEPVAALSVFDRSLTAASQSAGWKIPFISPWLLSGLPVYSKGFFIGQGGLPPIVYLPFMAAVMAMAWVLAVKLRPNQVELADSGPKGQKRIVTPLVRGKVWAISFVFIFTLLIYLGAYLVLGNRYQVWKYASFTALPLSFVPFGLAMAILGRLWLARIRLFSATAALAMLVFCASSLHSMGPLVGIQSKMYKITQNKELLNIFDKIINNQPKNMPIYFYFKDLSLPLLATELFKSQKEKKFQLLLPLFLYRASLNYLSQFNNLDNFTILSDVNFDGMFNSYRKDFDNGKIYLQTKYDIYEAGFISIFGVYTHENWRLKDNYFKFILNIPDKLKNKKLLLRLNIDIQQQQQQELSLPECTPKVRLRFYDSPVPLWGLDGSLSLEARVPDSLTAKGYFLATVRILGRDESSGQSPCKPIYALDRIELVEDLRHPE